MNTECTTEQLEFQGLGRRRVEAAFDGGHLSSDGGVLLLREVDARLGLTERFARCFTDFRNPDAIEHRVLELARQRVYGLALGYEDLNDHDDLMRDPLLALALGKRDLEGRNRHRKQDKGKALESWSRSRRVIAKAEHLEKGANPRFIVTNLDEDYASPQSLYEKTYCARGDMENRIKEQQLDLFADRASAGTFRANQLRLWFSSLAYVLVSAMRRTALNGTRMATATCGTIRLKLLKIGARIALSVRRIRVHLASACPYQDVFRQACHNLLHYPLRT